MLMTEGIQWRCKTLLRKYQGDIDDYRRRFGGAEGESRFLAESDAFEERIIEGNLLLNEGIEELFKLLTGGSATAYSNANARIGVGNGTAAADAAQTGLQGASTAFKAMDSGYPIVGAAADHKVTFRSSFGATEGNFAWEEWTVDNGSTANKNLNRKVESLGTKSGGTWQLTVEISLT